MKTLKFDNFRVKIKEQSSPTSNYSLSVWVYKSGNKSPEFGTHFKDGSTDKEILEWVFNNLNNQSEKQ